MTSNSGISLPQWFARYGAPSMPLFRDDGASVRETLARSAFAIATATAEKFAGRRRRLCGPTRFARSSHASATGNRNVLLIAEFESLDTINDAKDCVLEFWWEVALIAGQTPQIET